MHTFLLFLMAAAQQTPKQSVAGELLDPGIVATGQRITPAGVQRVFNGKVSGVRFGATSQDFWVAVPGAVQHVAWRDNRTLARVKIDGRPGVFALAIDPATKRVATSLVGSSRATHLQWFSVAPNGDTANPGVTSPAPGDYMAGAPALAAKPGPDGRRLAVLPLPANDALAVLDAQSGALLRKVPLGVEPIAAVISSDSRVAYVSILGGAKPGPGQLSSMQCCDVHAEAVRVEVRGFAKPGSVTRVDLKTGDLIDIPVGRHPTALAWDEQRGHLYVAAGNADTVNVIDTKSNTVATQIEIAPFRSRKPGLAPTALVLSPDRNTLYVALGGANALAVYDVGNSPAFRGLIPTSWYPSSVDVSADGEYIAVGSLFGVGAGAGTINGLTARSVGTVRGSVAVLAVPTPAELSAYTMAVSQNNRLILASAGPSPVRDASVVAPARAVPRQPGDSSLVNHVVFIVRENRTYDQVLGDLDRGSHDSSLVMYGRDVTPNAHALSRDFVTLDHFFVNAGNSADGHQWLTQANETEYPMWPLYDGRSYPFTGTDALAYSSGGFLWETAANKGKSVAVFGEFAPPAFYPNHTTRRLMLRSWSEHQHEFAFQRKLLAARYLTTSPIASLDRVLVRDYPGWTQETPDVLKAGDFLAHLGDWEAAHDMPNLVIMVLPNDHTMGLAPEWCTPRACVADNDLALGKVIEGLSHSSFWKDMAIFVVEDDAQDGVDHIDGHRTVALAISPYTRRGSVDSTMYTQPSMVKTIELMLGLPSLSIFDLAANDMRASFITRREQPNFASYTALTPAQSLFEENPRPSVIAGWFARQRKAATVASAKMILDRPDEAPAEKLNRILWHDARGWKTPYPAVRHAMVLPFAVDIDDADRAEKPLARTASGRKSNAPRFAERRGGETSPR